MAIVHCIVWRGRVYTYIVKEVTLCLSVMFNFHRNHPYECQFLTLYIGHESQQYKGTFQQNQ